MDSLPQFEMHIKAGSKEALLGGVCNHGSSFLTSIEIFAVFLQCIGEYRGCSFFIIKLTKRESRPLPPFVYLKTIKFVPNGTRIG